MLVGRDYDLPFVLVNRHVYVGRRQVGRQRRSGNVLRRLPLGEGLGSAAAGEVLMRGVRGS